MMRRGSVRPPRSSVPVAVLVTALVAALGLAGCSGDSDPDAGSSSGSGVAETSGAAPSGSATPAAEASETPYLPVPEGVELTEQGSKLALGETATVAWQPRQDLVGTLDIDVTRLEKTTFEDSFEGWKLDGTTRKTAPYFVRATITNAGDTDLAGQPVPLYAVDGANTLVEASTFKSTFTPCPSKPLPKSFPAGSSQQVCLVFLVPDAGELTAVSFRPTQEFDPVTWTGEVKAPKKDKPKKDEKGEAAG